MERLDLRRAFFFDATIWQGYRPDKLAGDSSVGQQEIGTGN
jgi:hypothetical protein